MMAWHKWSMEKLLGAFVPNTRLENVMIDMKPFEPNEQELAEGMICKNAVSCGICKAPAHRYKKMFMCSVNCNHVADTFVGIFSDLTYLSEIKMTFNPNNTLSDEENHST